MMVVNRWKIFLFLLGCVAAAVAVAYVAGVFDPYLRSRFDEHAEVSPEQATSSEGIATLKGDRLPVIGRGTENMAEEAVVPGFDIVRVEPDGGIVVAGRALPESTVELLAGREVVATARADTNGDFVIVPDSPLKPGDHQFVLRFALPGQPAVSSEETAIVSVPENREGQVFVMVEKPGEASKVLIAPSKLSQSAGSAEPALPGQPAEADESTTAPQAASSDETSPAMQPVEDMAVAVDAVEIEGRKIFVAGKGEPGRRVRIYADELLIGDAVIAPNGRFLVEAERDLSVGSYMIRADVLGDDGAQVVARAAVPFEREPGEAIAAVAPDTAAKAQTEDTVLSGKETGELGASSPQQDASASGEGAAPRLEPAASAVIIRRGDTLWHISRRVYGQGVRYSTIYLANRDQIANPDMIWPGQIFSLPERTQEGEAADLDAISGQIPDEAGGAPR